MINLLPPDVKSAYRYAARNVVLRQWIVVCVIALAGMGMIATYGLVSLKNSSADYRASIAASERRLKEEKFTETQKRVTDMSGSFKLVIKVLEQQILFSELLEQIGATIPRSAVLTGLNISQTKGALDISAKAIDYDTATQVQVNLSDPANKIFSKADIVSIDCKSQTGDGAVEPYPCSVTVKALFAADNPFLFINSKGKTPGGRP